MGSQEALLAGASIGLAIAAPIGPMALIVIRRTLIGGFLAGLMTGAGASTIHLLYAALALRGIDQIAAFLQTNRKLLDVVIASALVVFAIRILRQRPRTAEVCPQFGRSLIANYASALAFCLVNPMTFALLLSAIAAMSGLSSNRVRPNSSLVAGVFAGSIAWWICLVGATAFVGVRLSPRSVRTIDILAGSVMVVLAVSTILRSL